MDAKKYLQQVRTLESRIKNKQMELEYLKDQMILPSHHSDNTKVQTSRTVNKYDDPIAFYMDKEKKKLQEIDECMEKRDAIIKVIECLQNPMEYDVIFMLYVLGQGGQTVAQSLDRSYSWVTSTHKTALQHIQAILDSNNEDK
ncbi:MAG: hypothetical protein U0M21_01985 [Emergencia sp.]|nr:hypothetical protein [Emergencia sp.]